MRENIRVFRRGICFGWTLTRCTSCILKEAAPLYLFPSLQDAPLVVNWAYRAFPSWLPNFHCTPSSLCFYTSIVSPVCPFSAWRNTAAPSSTHSFYSFCRICQAALFQTSSLWAGIFRAGTTPATLVCWTWKKQSFRTTLLSPIFPPLHLLVSHFLTAESFKALPTHNSLRLRVS